MTDLPTIERRRGDTYANVVTIKSSDGNPVNLTGYTIVMTVDRRREPTDNTTMVFQITGVLTEPTLGRVSFTPTSLNAATAAGTYYYDIQLTSGTGVIKTAGAGKYVFKQDITK